MKRNSSNMGRNPLLSSAGKALQIYPGEWPKVLTLSAHTSLAVGILVLMQAVIVALFLGAYEASLLPYLFTAQALFFIAVSTAQASTVGKVSRRLETGFVLFLFMFSLAFSRAFLELNQKWFVFALYVWMQTIVEILLIQSGILVMASLDTREAKRMFSVVSAGGTLGAVVSGLAVTALSKSLGTENLLLACLPLAAGMFVIGNRVINRYVDDDASSGLPGSAGAEHALHGMKEAFSEVLKDKLLVIFLVVIVAMSMASTVVDFQFKSLLKENYCQE